MIILYNPFRGQRGPKHPTMTREQLRELARKHDVKRGRNLRDTVTNLRLAGINP